MANTFLYRSLCKIDDLSQDERKYLFEKTRVLKNALKANDTEILEQFKINSNDVGIYEVFLENSTRTKESFRNAAKFHQAKESEFLTLGSSFSKGESFADTFNMLIGYHNSIFIVRSKEEGLCTHLRNASEEYCSRNNLPYRASFINAGDGMHEHPTQELLDEFTFLEDNNFSYDFLHIALVGDLYYGRTVHSKANGLPIFKRVRVDLVAPPELAMPQHYVDLMSEHNFEIRIFSSIKEYLEQKDIADKWYFTRPQLERMGDRVLKIQDRLRAAITFSPDDLDKISKTTRFYHPLPRHKEHPTIPTALDKSFVNGWERQAINGMYVRIMLLALVSGKIGDDFVGEHLNTMIQDKEYIFEVETRNEKKQFSQGVNPIQDGIVIDHIAKGKSPQKIREHMASIIKILKLDNLKGGEWISTSGNSEVYKGIIFRPNATAFDRQDLKRLAAIGPGCTLNIIKNSRVLHKYRTTMPPRIYNFPDMSCKNTACISHPEQFEHVEPRFRKNNEDLFICEYCDTPHSYNEIWRK